MWRPGHIRCLPGWCLRGWGVLCGSCREVGGGRWGVLAPLPRFRCARRLPVDGFHQLVAACGRQPLLFAHPASLGLAMQGPSSWSEGWVRSGTSHTHWEERAAEIKAQPVSVVAASVAGCRAGGRAKLRVRLRRAACGRRAQGPRDVLGRRAQARRTTPALCT